MNGCLHILSTLASVIAYLIYFFKINVFFFNAFIAYTLPSFLYLTKNTLPNAPEPSSLIISN
jgi:hypothetical protein